MAELKPAYLIHGDDHGAVAERRAGLRTLVERRHQKRVPGRQRQHPSAVRAAARNFDHHPQKGGQVEFIAAEDSWLQDAIETGGSESLIGVVRDATVFLHRVLALAQHRAHRLGATEQFGGSKAGLWTRNRACRPFCLRG